MKAGIWLAPFVAEAKSALFRENPFWFCKDNNGDFIKCGSNWSGFYAFNVITFFFHNTDIITK